jgi:DNA-binding NarL/FixJ family response regulator
MVDTQSKGSPPECRVLIVEDAASTRRLLRAVLEQTTFEVVGESGTGRQALEDAERLHPDVILLDLSLPDIDGAELLPELLQLAPAAKVVVLSNTARLAGPDLIDIGATAYIEKGLPIDKLLDAVTDAVSDRPTSSANVAGSRGIRAASKRPSTEVPIPK